MTTTLIDHHDNSSITESENNSFLLDSDELHDLDLVSTLLYKAISRKVEMMNTSA